MTHCVDLTVKLLQIQACLKEIHTKMLRQYLERLEQPMDDEEKLETVTDAEPEEEESEHDLEGTFNLTGPPLVK